MNLNKEFIDKIKNEINLKELVEEYTVLIYRGNNRWYGNCPHPDHLDKTPSFHIKNNKWRCFACNKGGDCIDFIQWIHPNNLSWKESVIYLAKKYNIPIPEDKYEKEYERNKVIANKYSKDIGVEALNYLYSRGLSNDEIKKWNIGYDKYSNRIVFPLYNKNNKIVGFNKRIINNNKNDSKYINSKTSDIFKKSSYLYGLNYINNKSEYIIITEGVIDVILSTKYGLDNVICTLGTALTKDHIPIIKSLNKTIVIIYDGDKVGKESTEKAAKLLLDNDIYCKTVFLPNNYDLADTSLKYRHKLKNYIESEMCTYGYHNAQNIINNYNKELYELKLKYQPQLDEIIKKIPKKEKNTIRSFIENEIGLKASD